jgi:hypothetical protein
MKTFIVDRHGGPDVVRAAEIPPRFERASSEQLRNAGQDRRQGAMKP